MSAIAIARAALQRGKLTMHCQRGWYFKGNRFFSFETIRTLIDAGEARRIGDVVIARRKRVYVRTAPCLTHCKHGHEFTPENSDVYGDDRSYKRRRCRACRIERERERAKVRVRKASKGSMLQCKGEGQGRQGLEGGFGPV
jgi:hypothetical protein